MLTSLILLLVLFLLFDCVETDSGQKRFPVWGKIYVQTLLNYAYSLWLTHDCYIRDSNEKGVSIIKYGIVWKSYLESTPFHSV